MEELTNGKNELFYESDFNSSILRCNNENENRETNELELSALSSNGTFSDNMSNVRLETNKSYLNVACTNARSVVEKLDSLVTLFDENELHFAMLSETWLTPKNCPERKLDDLTHGANLKFIRRDRGRRGGGVAICYNPERLRLARFPVPQNGRTTEIVAAVGNTPLTKRKIAIISLYLSLIHI